MRGPSNRLAHAHIEGEPRLAVGSDEVIGVCPMRKCDALQRAPMTRMTRRCSTHTNRQGGGHGHARTVDAAGRRGDGTEMGDGVGGGKEGETEGGAEGNGGDRTWGQGGSRDGARTEETEGWRGREEG